MILAALVLAALSLGAEVFPEPLCENLAEVSPEVKTWVAQVAPELAQVRVRELRPRRDRLPEREAGPRLQARLQGRV